MDGEILISLTEKHTPTAAHVAALRRELPKRFPDLQFFFQPADIVNQVLNFGQPAPIDVRVSGPKSDETYALAQKIAHDLNAIPGVVDSHVFQVPDAPALTIDVDRTLAQQLGLNEDEIAKDVLVTANSSAQTVPNFWIDPQKQCELSAGRANADLSPEFDRGSRRHADNPDAWARNRVNC